jgi:hypothetical protein
MEPEPPSEPRIRLHLGPGEHQPGSHTGASLAANSSACHTIDVPRPRRCQR